jgi:transcriptional regulator with XRE-family HTH domain
MKTDIKLNTYLLKEKIQLNGYTPKLLSKELDVSEASLSYWLSGQKLPGYPKLKMLCNKLGITMTEAMFKEELYSFKFRKNRQSKVTHNDNVKVHELINALEELFPIIEEKGTFPNEPLKLRKPVCDYDYYQSVSKDIREKLNDKLTTENILNFIKSQLNTLIIPVLWGSTKPFCNAVKITNLSAKISFLYLNLNSKEEDIKFWLLHEAAHIIAPGINEIEEERFADDLAGAILFSREEASEFYMNLQKLGKESEILKQIFEDADKLEIAPYTIYKQLEALISFYNLENLLPEPQKLFNRKKSQSDYLINDEKINAEQYIYITKNRYKSDIFDYLKEYLHSDKSVSFHYIKKLLNIPAPDALQIYQELINE